MSKNSSQRSIGYGGHRLQSVHALCEQKCEQNFGRNGEKERHETKSAYEKLEIILCAF